MRQMQNLPIPTTGGDYVIWVGCIRCMMAFQMYGFDGIQRGNYFRGKPIGRAEAEVRMGKLKDRKAVGKDEITGEMI